MAFANLSLRAHNPLFAREKGRNILPYTFDDSLDSSKDLECFFVMPDAVRAIRKARVWVERKPYRAYSTGAASEASHTHSVTISSHSHGITYTNGVTGDSNPEFHNHSHLLAQTTTDSGGSSSPTSAAGSSHAHAFTYAISESGPTGTISLFVADDGTNYGSAIVTGSSAISDQDITSQLTRASGSKRLKITATGLMRVQVFLLLDLSVAVFS